ncbi:hypothetical protein PUNSTDRAFT_112000 [Punctularia strigosozonata HHB-11173 SS5]|uniref:uncharacterized protein n=1 Tax=Punctularia strigosozonata (strain HHB-11173) TaxID=741275 RepID=UPI00044181E7|nr:uncharacterized protein PUNSTDRAFT_112000 [Punctularia strigosozonata HHB-11173 SS5]EIN12032.1 hypothetical protein PUNSTDRAFT_112000 [Punctularia strigosozonata HHB-11173 SS5]
MQADPIKFDAPPAAEGSSSSAQRISYHPLFASPEADVILGSKDGLASQCFRVHSFTLKITSGWFRTMFTLPQTTSSLPPSSDPEKDIIFLDEDQSTVEGILRMVCGLPIPNLSSYDSIEPLLYAAEKYDMPGPLSIIRMLVMTPAVIDDPLRLYAVACRYGWEHEAKHASKQSLSLNLHAPEHRDQLRKLSTDSLMNLFDLHYRRREELKRMLDDPPFVNAADPHIICSMCDYNVDYHTWRELKYAIAAEMDVRPLGDTVLSHGLTEWPAAKACWNAKCANGDCARLLYDKGETLRLIKECMDKLPATI